MKSILSFLFLCRLGILTAQQYADCDSAMYICNKSTFEMLSCVGEGANTHEARLVDCFINGESMGHAEKNSTWLKFQIKKDGKLMFTITPKDSIDDIDFVVYQLYENALCSGYKSIVRCMAAGNKTPLSRCMGATGLRAKERDYEQDAGCSDYGDNNFLAPINAEKGEFYALLISNFSSTSGFSIQFYGSALLMCEE